MSAENHTAQIEALSRKVKELCDAFHDAERSVGRMKEQLWAAEQKGEVDRAELAQLRETLYQLRAGEDLPDLNNVRDAVVVWLQVNAMSHKYYDHINDVARKNGIPVRYFGSASAKKCAVQLALEELETEKGQDEV